MNVALIRGIMAARDQQAFEAADRRIAEGLHPSLFAEVDWMEMSVPPDQRANARRLADGMFMHHLPAIAAARRVEFDLPDEDLRAEITEHWSFYDFLIKEARDVLGALGSDLDARIRRAFAGSARDDDAAAARAYSREAPRVRQVFSHVQDRRWLVLLSNVEIDNAVAYALDHVSSRMDAKQFVREGDGRFPSLQRGEVRNADDLSDVRRRLELLGGRALASRQFRLYGVCRAIDDVVADLRLTALDRFCGERARGYGTCGTCSMYYASSAIVSFDPTCPQLLDEETGRIFLPLDFNVSTCPFCGAEQRAETASLFYSPDRHQVIYNVPTLGQLTDDQALAQYKPLIAQLRELYIARVSAEDAAAFQTASEEFTHSMADFLLAIQMGTTVREEHVYNVVRLANGSGLLVDPTKNVIIALTRAELARHWARGATIDAQPAAGESGPELPAGGANLHEAMSAYATHDYARARDILEALHARHPGDMYVRQNLAVIYVALGDRDAARRLLSVV